MLRVSIFVLKLHFEAAGLLIVLFDGDLAVWSFAGVLVFSLLLFLLAPFASLVKSFFPCVYVDIEVFGFSGTTVPFG